MTWVVRYEGTQRQFPHMEDAMEWMESIGHPFTFYGQSTNPAKLREIIPPGVTLSINPGLKQCISDLGIEWNPETGPETVAVCKERGIT